MKVYWSVGAPTHIHGKMYVWICVDSELNYKGKNNNNDHTKDVSTTNPPLLIQVILSHYNVRVGVRMREF